MRHGLIWDIFGGRADRLSNLEKKKRSKVTQGIMPEHVDEEGCSLLSWKQRRVELLWGDKLKCSVSECVQFDIE